MTRRNTANAAISGIFVWILLIALWLGHFARTGDPLPHWSSAAIPAVETTVSRG